MTTQEQRAAALLGANQRRAELAHIRRDLLDGTLDLLDVLRDPPEILHPWPIVDAVRYCRNVSRRSAPAWFMRMGRAAAREDVNLLMPLGSASERSREWVAEYVAFNRHDRARKRAA